MKNKKGFTLIELIVVIAIISILVLLAAPKLSGYLEETQLIRIKHDIKVMENKVSEKLLLETDEFALWENNLKDLNILVSSNKLHETAGLVGSLDTKSDFNVIPNEYNNIIKTKLDGTFYANPEGKVYYEHDKSISGGTLTVKYEDQNKVLIEKETRTASRGTHIISPKVIRYYSLVGPETQTVKVNSKNKAPQIIFTYKQIRLATDADFSGDDDGTFRYVGSDPEIRIPHIIKGVQVTSYANMFAGTNVTKVVSDNPRITDMHYAFSGSLGDSLDLSDFDTSNVKDMHYMFSGSVSNILDLTGFDTSKVIDMHYMFSGSYAKSINLTSFNTSNVEDMHYMFSGSLVPSLDLSSFDTSKVVYIHYIFSGSKVASGIARTKQDASIFNNSAFKPDGLNFLVKGKQ